MTASNQSDPFRMRRVVRDGLTPRPAPVFTPGRSQAEGHAENSIATSLEDDVTQSIKSIEHVAKNFSAMKENFHFYKDLVVELRTKLDEEKNQREDLQREVAAMERMIRSERERATRAEQHVKTSETVIRDLEHQLSSLQAQTARLVKAITLLISTDSDVRDETDSNLRLVS